MISFWTSFACSGLHVWNALLNNALPASDLPISFISGNAAFMLSRHVSVAPPTALTPREIAMADPSSCGYVSGNAHIGAEAAIAPANVMMASSEERTSAEAGGAASCASRGGGGGGGWGGGGGGGGQPISALDQIFHRVVRLAVNNIWILHPKISRKHSAITAAEGNDRRVRRIILGFDQRYQGCVVCHGFGAAAIGHAVRHPGNVGNAEPLVAMLRKYEHRPELWRQLPHQPSVVDVLVDWRFVARVKEDWTAGHSRHSRWWWLLPVLVYYTDPLIVAGIPVKCCPLSAAESGWVGSARVRARA